MEPNEPDRQKQQEIENVKDILSGVFAAWLGDWYQEKMSQRDGSDVASEKK